MQNFNPNPILDDAVTVLSTLSGVELVSRDMARRQDFIKNTAATQLPALFVLPRPDAASSAKSLSSVHTEVLFRWSVIGLLEAPEDAQQAALTLSETVLSKLLEDPFRSDLADDTRLEGLGVSSPAEAPYVEFRLDFACPFVFER